MEFNCKVQLSRWPLLDVPFALRVPMCDDISGSYFYIQARAKKHGGELRLHRVLFRTIRKGLVISGLLKFMSDTSSFASPYLITGAINWIERYAMGTAGEQETVCDQCSQVSLFYCQEKIQIIINLA